MIVIKRDGTKENFDIDKIQRAVYSAFKAVGKPMPDYLVMYNRKSKDECTLVYWDEVVSWVYEYHNAVDILKLELTDGSIESVEMYSRRSIRKMMNLYAKDKEKKRRNGSTD